MIRSTVLTAVVLTLLLLPAAGSAQPYDPVPGPSPYGPDDQAGASNTQGPEKVKEALKLIKRGIVLQLGHVYKAGMPQFPGTHPWVLSLRQPDVVGERQMSVGEVLDGPIEIGQLGTQFDTLGHFGYLPPGGTGFADVLFYNQRTGADLLPAGAPNQGLAQLGVEHIKPYFTRGILLDVARYVNHGQRLVAGQEITVAMLLETLAAEKLKPEDIREGDAVLIRTGHEELWGAPNYYLDVYPGLGVTLAEPGLGIAAAIWLSERKIGVVGSDNWGLDVLPNFNAPRRAPGPGAPPLPGEERHPHAGVDAPPGSGRRRGLRVRLHLQPDADQGSDRLAGHPPGGVLGPEPCRGERRRGYGELA